MENQFRYVPVGFIDDKSAMVYVMIKVWLVKKPIPDPVINNIDDAIWHQWGTQS